MSDNFEIDGIEIEKSKYKHKMALEKKKSALKVIYTSSSSSKRIL